MAGRSAALGLVAGALVLTLVGTAIACAFPGSSPIVPEHDGGDTTWSWLYLVSVAGAFAAYVAGIVLLGRAGGIARRRAVVVLAVAIQALPLVAPVLLSTDVYTYWDYGRIAAVHDGNPYVDVPNDYPDDPAYPLMGSRWHDTTSVYGPGLHARLGGAREGGRRLARRGRLDVPGARGARDGRASSSSPRGCRRGPRSRPRSSAGTRSSPSTSPAVGTTTPG